MSDKSAKKRTTQGKRLSLELGTKLTVTTKGIGSTLKVLLVGLEPDAFLIIRLPEATEPSDAFSEGSRIKLKYISWGNVYGFKSDVLGQFQNNDMYLLILSYPSSIKSYDMRKEERVDSYIPATMMLEKKNYAGCLLDISPSGCRFEFGGGGEKSAPLLSLTEKVKLSFHLPEQSEKQVFIGRIRGIRQDTALSIVIQFDLDSEAAFSSRAILDFLNQKHSYKHHK